MIGKGVEILVTVADTSGQTSVVTIEHRVVGIVSIIAELLDTIVAPVANGLISSELVGVPVLANETRGTAIQAIDIAGIITPAVAGHGQVGITLIEKAGGCHFRRHVRIDRLYIQVAGAGGEAQASDGCHYYEFTYIGFHNDMSYEILEVKIQTDDE